MKTNSLSIFKTFSYFLAALFFISITASCEVNDDIQEPLTISKKSITEIMLKVNDYNTTAKPAPMKGDEAIAAIAINNNFTQLVAALQYVDEELDTNLVETFSSNDAQYTVFAPTDAAFNDLYVALGVNGISDLDPQLVYDVLLYHVTDGRRATNSVVPKKNYKYITTLLGAEFQVTSTPEIIAIGNTASFGTTDISASNGIIHVVNSVLLPIVP